MSEWDEYADGWDQDSGARVYAEAANRSLSGLLDASERSLDGSRVLDFGCGTGLLTERLVLAGASVHAVDTSPAMIAVLDRKIAQRGWTKVTTAADLPNEPESYDVIVCSSVCAFLDDYRGTVAELVALLRPGGLFVQWDWERTTGTSHGLSRDEIEHVLGAVGLEETSVTTGFTEQVGEQVMRPLMGCGRRPV